MMKFRTVKYQNIKNAICEKSMTILRKATTIREHLQGVQTQYDIL